MAETIETLLLLALPASGKSEVRRYLDSLSPEVCRRDFHMGQTVQLDDFPYVHAMRRIDDELVAMGKPRLFFQAADRSFREPADWGTLIQLVNEDYDDLVSRRDHLTQSSAAPDQPSATGLDANAEWLFDRLDAASVRAGATARMATLDSATRAALAERLAGDAEEMLREKVANYPDTLNGKTVVIEFARGGPEGSDMPLPTGYGYHHTLPQLAPEILERAAILYIWVTPEESRRKNQNRADPDDPGSILHHGVPEAVMRNDYGTDDIDWLIASSEVPQTVTVHAHKRVFHLPIGRFDNREDKTTFLRGEVAEWPASAVESLRTELKRALDEIHTTAERLPKS